MALQLQCAACRHAHSAHQQPGKGLHAAGLVRFTTLRAQCRVGAHGAAAVDMTAQGGGATQHRHAVVSFHHALHSPDFRGADGVTSPAWVTAELRCTADFKSTSQPQLVESLRIGIDVEVRPAAAKWWPVAGPGISQHADASAQLRPVLQQPVCV